MKAIKLISDANELLMQLRLQSEYEKKAINQEQLYSVQMFLYKALDELCKREQFQTKVNFHAKAIIDKLVSRPCLQEIDGYYDRIADEDQMVEIVQKYLEQLFKP